MTRRPSDEEVEDLARAQWLLRTAKAECADAIYRAEQAEQAMRWAFVFALVCGASSVVCIGAAIGWFA